MQPGDSAVDWLRADIPQAMEAHMGEVKSETHPVPATVVDKMFGDATEEGAKTDHGEVVTETVTETEDKDDD